MVVQQLVELSTVASRLNQSSKTQSSQHHSSVGMSRWPCIVHECTISQVEHLLCILKFLATFAAVLFGYEECKLSSNSSAVDEYGASFQRSVVNVARSTVHRLARFHECEQGSHDQGIRSASSPSGKSSSTTEQKLALNCWR